ncbi:IclR family transcriptional regulator [Fredinandcohnia sp. QZ13]|uniref:IclR family transcriptional regulator n=1 Tax=Fredinandcohnia sp. QZ13 TaxID=3073144 RepID=UPI00285328D7|nr:IclR family transcriptional regulator [Fredinandcohnia sp. QZ13]MDR4887614.1 IclR family transcriptional regulator [Fredinandcohnia sp. QZ13]
MQEKKQPYGTVLIKADSILKYLSSTDKPQSLQQIAKETELTSSTALKILDTLQLIGYVQKDEETKKFRLGRSIIKYANKALNQTEIKDLAQPFLEKLREQTTETVHMGILDQSSIIYITKLESFNPVSLYSRVGKAIPLYCSAMGKSILADQTDEQIEEYFNNHTLVKKTENTITTKEGFMKEIHEIRKNGYAFDNEEHEADIFCVGASITVNGKNYGAFSVSVPKYRITDEFITQIIENVLACKRGIESELG